LPDWNVPFAWAIRIAGGVSEGWANFGQINFADPAPARPVKKQPFIRFSPAAYL
jgi:hypothetical protein